MTQVPISEKYMLTIDEASVYFHLGQKLIRRLVKEWPNATFYLNNGNRVLIKRKQFEEFLDEMDEV